MKLLFRLLPPAGFLAASALAASVALDPVGVVKVSCLGSSDTIVSLPLSRPAIYTGAATASVVTANATATLTFSGSPFAAGALVHASGTQPDTYCAFLASGTKEGSYYTVTANTAASVTIDLNGDDLSAVGSVTVKIIPYWTLGTVFPAGAGVTASSGFTAATQVLLPDQATAGTNLAAAAIYYFSSSAGTWLRSGGSASADDTVLYPDSSFTIRNNGVDATTFALVGGVTVNKQAVHLATETTTRQDNAVALARPVPVALDDSGLVSSGAFTASSGFTPGDQLFVYDNTVAQLHKAAARIYTYANGAWRRSGATGDAGADSIFTPGTGVLIRKASTAGGATATWTIPAPTVD